MRIAECVTALSVTYGATSLGEVGLVTPHPSAVGCHLLPQEKANSTFRIPHFALLRHRRIVCYSAVRIRRITQYTASGMRHLDTSNFNNMSSLRKTAALPTPCPRRFRCVKTTLSCFYLLHFAFCILHFALAALPHYPCRFLTARKGGFFVYDRQTLDKIRAVFWKGTLLTSAPCIVYNGNTKENGDSR